MRGTFGGGAQGEHGGEAKGEVGCEEPGVEFVDHGFGGWEGGEGLVGVGGGDASAEFDTGLVGVVHGYEVGEGGLLDCL